MQLLLKSISSHVFTYFQVEVGASLTELKEEIRTLRKCNSPHIVTYKGNFHKGNEVWIVLEFCPAGSMCDLMSICDLKLNERQIAAVVKMSLLGLEYLHTKSKIHRDLKCGNILIGTGGECKLADFGVSAQLTDTLPNRKTVVGTPFWMAPEVLTTSSEYNTKADIWYQFNSFSPLHFHFSVFFLGGIRSLGITAMEMALGDPPHSDLHPMRAIFVIPTSPPPTLPNPDRYSNEFKDFLRVCLAKVNLAGSFPMFATRFLVVQRILTIALPLRSCCAGIPS